jgi:hypothetical protein
VLPTGTSNGASDSKPDHAPVTHAPHAQDVPSTVGLVESIAHLIAELAEVRVISDRRADRIAEQAETIGTLRVENTVLRASQAQQDVNPGPIASALTTNAPVPLSAQLRVLAPWALAALAIGAVVVLLLSPR